MTKTYPNLIGGELVTTDRTIDVINPANEQVIGQVPSCGKAELDEAVAAARAAGVRVVSIVVGAGVSRPASGAGQEEKVATRGPGGPWRPPLTFWSDPHDNRNSRHQHGDATRLFRPGQQTRRA